MIMPGHIPALDQDSLRRLRKLVRSMQVAQRESMPMADIVGLANFVGTDAHVTIDFDAENDLGAPLVVMRVPDKSPSRTMLANLSERELEVASLVAQGLANKQIAARLQISLATVKDHVHNILSKTGVPNRAAIAAAYSTPVVSPRL
jgi:DNA-binding CsgD family transcriptional regulator